MRNNFLFLREKAVSAAFVSVLALFAACDKGIDADETFTSDVTNSQLESPKAEDVTMTLSADGKTLVVDWHVVYGAGGYEFTLYNVDDPANPEAVGEEKEFIDGCSAVRSVKTDCNYQVSIRTLGNEKYNNTEAAATTDIAYSTLAPTDVTIEEAGDINAWLAANPIPADKLGKEYIIDLVGGQEYTVSDEIDFKNQNVTIRGGKKNHAKIKMTGKACFLTNNGFKLKFVDIDCSAKESEMLLGNSKEADPASQVTSGEYVVANPILLQGCNVTDLKGYLYYDNNKVKYCVDYLGFDDCVIQMHQDNIVLRAAKSTIIRLDVVNSTLWSTKQAGQYFVQISGQRPNKITGRTGADINFKNTTFHNIAYNKDFANWNQYRGQSCVSLNFYNTIFSECGRGDITNKMQGNANMKHDYKSNAYWYKGEGKDKYDTGALFEDPLFEDASAGKFTPGNANYVGGEIGDPRWLE